MRVFAVLAFLLVPLAEIAVLIQVGQVIGPWWTILLLIAMSVAGAWLVRREWRGTWQALTAALGSGRIPSRELVDAGLVVVGGTLLLTPGFLSDVLGFLILLPLTRPIARRIVVALIARRMSAGALVWPGGPIGGPRGGFGSSARGASRSGPVIAGQVVDGPEPERPTPPR